jgi:bacterial/archaeal transporter family protein
LQLFGWQGLSFVVLLCWGVLAVFQKLAMNRISAQSAMVWTAGGMVLLQLFFFPDKFILYSAASLGWALLNGVFNGLGIFFLLTAMRNGGKASIVEPLSALYPVLVVLLAPFILRESISGVHAVGVLCATISGILLSAESRQES